MGTTDANRILDVFNELKEMSDSTIQDLLTKATVRTGLFKRRMVHVARRFGALKKWVDLSRVSLQKLVKSLEGTAIYDEALKEVFTKDLDLKRMLRVVDEVRKNEVEIMKLDTDGTATPVARVGIERVSMKTDLIPPERMRLILLETTRARLLNETRTFICANCWDYIEMIRIKDLPDKPTCPQCGSTNLGVLRKEEDEVYSILEKKGEKLNKTEEKTTRWAQKTGRLMSSHGKLAATALSAKRVTISDVERILNRENEASDRFFELIIEAERRALKKGF